MPRQPAAQSPGTGQTATPARNVRRRRRNAATGMGSQIAGNGRAPMSTRGAGITFTGPQTLYLLQHGVSVGQLRGRTST